MADLIPAFDAFYASLTPEQQTQLNTWISEHHGHRA
jgi:Spy/CpxP family protein refolding chaperone